MKKFGLCVLMVFLTVQSASAQTNDFESRQYMGGSFGIAFESFDDTGSFDVDESIVLGVQLGMRFKENFGIVQPAVELKFRYYDGFDVNSGVSGKVGEVDGWSVSVRPKAYFGNSIFRPFAYVGFGWMSAKHDIDGSGSVSDNDQFIEIGGGVEMSSGRMQGWFLEANYILPQGNLDGFDAFEFEIGYNFQF